MTDKLYNEINKEYKLYINIFKKLPKKIGILCWVNPEKLKTHEYTSWENIGNLISMRIKKDDPFLNNNSFITGLAKSLKKYGTYWPIYVGKGSTLGGIRNGSEQGNQFVVDEGTHRVLAFQMLKETENYNRDICVLYHPWGYTYKKEVVDTDPEFFGRKLKRKFKVIIPKKAFIHDGQGKNIYDDKFIDKVIQEAKFLKSISKNNMEFSIEYGLDFHNVSYRFSVYLRNRMFEYKKITGKMFPPSKAFNIPGHTFPIKYLK